MAYPYIFYFYINILGIRKLVLLVLFMGFIIGFTRSPWLWRPL